MFQKNRIAGVDEVGRGCLAGPVFSAAVILNEKINKKDIKDSKKIPFKKRILLSKYIKKNSIYAVGTASVKEINKINILNASLLSMQRALDKLKLKPSIVYIDGLFAPKGLKIKHKTFVKGDEKITCISAASIVAKVTRDLFMIKLAKKYAGEDADITYRLYKIFLKNLKSEKLLNIYEIYSGSLNVKTTSFNIYP